MPMRVKSVTVSVNGAYQLLSSAICAYSYMHIFAHFMRIFAHIFMRIFYSNTVFYCEPVQGSQ